MKAKVVIKNDMYVLNNGEKGKGKFIATIPSKKALDYLNSKYEIVNYEEIASSYPKETFLAKLRRLFIGI